jgi:hypothetical protein
MIKLYVEDKDGYFRELSITEGQLDELQAQYTGITQNESGDWIAEPRSRENREGLMFDDMYELGF